MKKFLSLLLLLVLVVGCSSSPKVLKDRAGLEFEKPKEIKSIISVAPSNTEILVGLGLGDKIIGVDEYSKDSIEGLNDDVALVNFRDTNVEAIIDLKPDVLIASTHNADSKDDPFALVKEAGIIVVYIPVSSSIDGIKEDITFLGELTNTESKAKTMNSDITKEVDRIKAIAKEIPEDEKKTVFFEIAPAPSIFTVGGDTFINEFITLVGAKNVFADEKGWPNPSIESIVSLDPQIYISNVSYDENTKDNILNEPLYKSMKAIKNKEVYVVDVNKTSRSSQLSISFLEDLGKIIYPEYYGK